MKKDEVMQEFRKAGALLEGHFLLSSGLHSPVYLQCARVLMNGARAEKLCGVLADRIRVLGKSLDYVVSPAMGGVIVGYEMGRQLKIPSMFMERVDGVFELRRGFAFPKGARILMMEDVVTTGLSSRECIEAIERIGGQVVLASALVDRSGGKADVGVPLVALMTIDAPTYQSDNLPESLKNLPAVKPGSRGMA